MSRDADPADQLGHYQVGTEPALFAIGPYDKHVTVRSQQVRALNLAWALIESGRLPTRDGSARIAIVGTGFSGLTLATALRNKRVRAEIVLFEERDTLLPLQQGSDTRWLHPHVYDWPSEGSEASAAMLPVMNWTAARASDVVVQVLGEWRQAADLNVEPPSGLRLYCNTRHLQISPCRDDPRRARVEWVGEAREPRDGALPEGASAKGTSESFDLVVLAVGFGVETGDPSYWRNDMFGQPSLDTARNTYMVSGQGDGAMIDLFRVRISQFRQDRILDELFGGRPALVSRLRAIRDADGGAGRFERLDELLEDGDDGLAMRDVLDELSRRLRRDTDAVLHLRVRSLADLLEPTTSRMSFQNAVLAYMLYRCGGFAPSREDEDVLAGRYGIARDHIIRRHGTKPLEQMRRLLSDEFYAAIQAKSGALPGYHLQPSDECWPGGYFGSPGSTADAAGVSNATRRHWRKEYLPGATAVIASTLCGAVAACLERLRPGAAHFRTTLHRTLDTGREELLQQCCDYVGAGLAETTATAGRTFPARAGTIGLAYASRRIVRTREDAGNGEIERDMDRLKLHDAARDMLGDVSFVLAIPVLQPDRDHYKPNPVAAVLYIDSRSPGFWLDAGEVDEIRLVVERSVRSLESAGDGSLGRLRNLPLRDRTAHTPAGEPPAVDMSALEVLADPAPASTRGPFVLNFDHSDLAPATTSATGDGAANTGYHDA